MIPLPGLLHAPQDRTADQRISVESAVIVNMPQLHRWATLIPTIDAPADYR